MYIHTSHIHGLHPLILLVFHVKTSVMPYVKPSTNKKLQIWMMDGGVNHLLTMCRLNLNLQILAEILVSHMGGSIIFNIVQAESEV